MKTSILIIVMLLFMTGCKKNDSVSDPGMSISDTIPRIVVDSIKFEKGESIPRFHSLLSSYIVWHMWYHFTLKPAGPDYHTATSIPPFFNYAVTWEYFDPFAPGRQIYFTDTIFAYNQVAQKGSTFLINLGIHYHYYDQIPYQSRTELGQADWTRNVLIDW